MGKLTHILSNLFKCLVGQFMIARHECSKNVKQIEIL